MKFLIKQVSWPRSIKSIVQFFLMAFTLSHAAFATKIAPTDTRTLVKKADYILIGEVVIAEIVDEKGTPLIGDNARTYPGSGNILRYYVRVDRDHVIKGKKANIPEYIFVRAWPMWQITLEYSRKMEGKKYIFLLNEKFEPSSIREFIRSLSEKKEIENSVR
jgi:hypothetical protein